MFRANCQVATPCCPGSCSTWLTTGLSWGCFLFPLTHCMAETKGQWPQHCCPTGEGVVPPCKGAPLPVHSSSRTLAAKAQHLPGEVIDQTRKFSRVWWQRPEHSRALGSSSIADLESWEATFNVLTFSRTNVYVLIFFILHGKPRPYIDQRSSVPGGARVFSLRMPLLLYFKMIFIIK